jgi:hypothetical protein
MNLPNPVTQAFLCLQQSSAIKIYIQDSYKRVFPGVFNLLSRRYDEVHTCGVLCPTPESFAAAIVDALTPGGGSGGAASSAVAAAVSAAVGLALFPTLSCSKKHQLLTASVLHVTNLITRELQP